MSVNDCTECWEKQRQIDRLEGEVKRLKDALRYKERKEKGGFFGSSTSSAKLPVKPNVPDRPKKKRVGKRGHKGAGRWAAPASLVTPCSCSGIAGRFSWIVIVIVEAGSWVVPQPQGLP